MQQNIKLTINSIQHIGVPVTNLGRSVAFYESLGFDKAMEAPFAHDGETGNCIMMKRASVIMELYQLPEKELEEIRRRTNGHIDHIAFDVPDIDEAFSALRSAGFDIIEKEPVFLAFWQKGCRYFNLLGPDGERLEFNQIL